tara:strand:- start:575 stop:811 length:237 start_codon:yes stop_codon:yes gene_type:complete
MEQDDNRDILNNINKIENSVKKLKLEKENLQQNCVHNNGHFTNFDERKSIKNYCSLCKKEIGYASAGEQKQFLTPKGK